MPTRIEVESNVLEVQDSGEIVTLDGNPAFVVGLQMEIPRHYDGEAFRTPGVGVIEQIFLLYPGARILPDGGPVKGGAGSGNHGHAGRPGKRGGSAPSKALKFGNSPAAREIEQVWRSRYAKRQQEIDAMYDRLERESVALDPFSGETTDLFGDIRKKSASLVGEFEGEVFGIIRMHLGDNAVGNRFRYDINDNTMSAKPGVPLEPQKRAMIARCMAEFSAATHIDSVELMGVRFHIPEDYEGSPDCMGGFFIRIPRNDFSLKRSTVFHELGHVLEGKAGNRDVALRFLEHRSGGLDRIAPLNEIVGANLYDDEYVGVQGKFVDVYAAKVYRSKNGSIIGTEIISTGLEKIMVNPYSFFRKDPEHFGLMVDILTAEVDPDVMAN